jgi:hypothetical protein
LRGNIGRWKDRTYSPPFYHHGLLAIAPCLKVTQPIIIEEGKGTARRKQEGTVKGRRGKIRENSLPASLQS